MKRINLLLSAVLLCTCMFGQKAPDFTITDYKNVEHTLYADYLDKGTIVMIKVMFVACPPCRSAAPGVQDLYEHYGEGQDSVQFIELSNKDWDYNSSLKAFSEEFGLTYPGAGFNGGALTALSGYINGTYGTFRGTPTYIIIAPNGDVQFDVRFTSIKAAIDKLKSGGGGGGGGGGGCSNTFNGVISEYVGTAEVILKSDVAGAASFVVNPGGELDYSYECEFPFPAQALEYKLKVEKDGDDIDGISTADIVRILRHLLALDIYTTTEQKIASDFTANRKVSAQDMSEMRKLVLGRFNENPHHNSWMFFSADQDFSGDNSGTLIPRLDTTLPIMDVVNKVYSGNFTGIKLGDVTGDINVFLNGPIQTRGTFSASTTREWIKAGETFTTSLVSNDIASLTGIQGTITTQHATITSITNAQNWEAGIFEDGQTTTFSLYDAYAYEYGAKSELITVEAIAEVDGYTDELINFNDSRTKLLAIDRDLNENNIIVNTAESSDRVKLFPNPTGGAIYLQNVSAGAQLKLIDINGQYSNVTMLNNKIDTEALIAGVYWIELTSNDGRRERLKFLKL